jgi:murein DD-endopeptidase MepM/ murein hydrolase activator NlpD
MARRGRDGSLPHPPRERRPLIRVLSGIGALACVLSVVQPLPAQDSVATVTVVRSEPEPLLQGTVGWLLVRTPQAKLTGGSAAGEAIQFDSVADTEYRGLLGVPLDVSDSISVVLFLTRDDRVDTVQASVAVAAGGYPRETITVAPGLAKPNAAASARIQRENARSRQVSLASRDRTRLWNGPFQLPRAARTTSVFGAARVYNGEVKSRHTGTDFAGAVGASVAAAGRGIVALVADFYLAGRAVYIDHGGGLVTAYFHLSRVEVAQGDTVSGGQRIGAVGQSGRVTGPHLHWVARYGVISVDPMSLLKLESVRGER